MHIQTLSSRHITEEECLEVGSVFENPPNKLKSVLPRQSSLSLVGLNADIWITAGCKALHDEMNCDKAIDIWLDGLEKLSQFGIDDLFGASMLASNLAAVYLSRKQKTAASVIFKPLLELIILPLLESDPEKLEVWMVEALYNFSLLHAQNSDSQRAADLLKLALKSISMIWRGQRLRRSEIKVQSWVEWLQLMCCSLLGSQLNRVGQCVEALQYYTFDDTWLSKTCQIQENSQISDYYFTLAESLFSFGSLRRATDALHRIISINQECSDQAKFTSKSVEMQVSNIRKRLKLLYHAVLMNSRDPPSSAALSEFSQTYLTLMAHRTDFGGASNRRERYYYHYENRGCHFLDQMDFGKAQLFFEAQHELSDGSQILQLRSLINLAWIHLHKWHHDQQDEMKGIRLL
jgi:tetratricopeptide (TPR) repeat protein